MFSSTGLFQKITCPQGVECQLVNCIFSHATLTTSDEIWKVPQLPTSPDPEQDLGVQTRPSKKRRIDGILREENESLTIAAANILEKSALPRKAPSKTIDHAQKNIDLVGGSNARSAAREISPPPLRCAEGRNGNDMVPKDSSEVKIRTSTKPAESKPNADCQESLNPRLMNKPPATHAARLRLITILHEQMARLNDEIKFSHDPSRVAFELSPQELIIAALEDEQKIANENYSVYSNVIKLRILALKKMKLEDWKNERLKQIAEEYPDKMPPEAPKPLITLETSLSEVEEIALLPKLVTQQEALAKHGYVPFIPSEAEVERARAGVEASQGWEQCDRCQSRFQVFPGRRAEDGALTSGGKCVYHFGKPRRPTREKGETGHKDSVYLCCGQILGTSGCTTADSHVFKVSDAKRLAAVMQFMSTPVKGPKHAQSAVCFDCEMGYTTLGMELIRLTAVSWPKGEELLDVLVRPIGEILDLNSRFSGIWPQQFQRAVPLKGNTVIRDKQSKADRNEEKQLRLVDSIAKARALLFDLLTTTTPLIGHAIENDLNAARIIHPNIIDTVLLYPHPRGLPMRNGLKMLVKKYLNMNIQMGGAQGHDSKEDAKAAGDLVRLKVGETWRSMMRDGWTVKEGSFYPPLPSSRTFLKPKLPC
ncbi:RNA exonuclease 3 [Schaereria dolodes]|nr:RNA exonuclease 3 [Schaereria dolodes]